MQVRLPRELFEYLLKGNFLDERERAILMKAPLSGDQHVVDISDDDADTIRDACGERLQRVGFDAEYNPTNEGTILEQLIDRFLVR